MDPARVLGKQSEERASSLVTEGFSACPLSVRLSSCSARVPQRAHDVCRSEVCDSPCSAHAKPHVHEQHFLEPPSDPDQLVQSVCRDDCEVQPTASAFVVGAHDRVVPSLPHRIKSLRLRLAALQLRAASYFHGEDPRASDGPSMRGLAVLQEAPPGQGEGHLKEGDSWTTRRASSRRPASRSSAACPSFVESFAPWRWRRVPMSVVDIAQQPAEEDVDNEKEEL